MARTIAEIQNEMIAAKEAESSLSGLTSTSQTAIWNLIFYICAVSIKFLEDLFDVLEADVEARRLEIPVGVLRWYASESLVYQLGDELIFSNGRLDYAIIDTEKYVVDLAAADIVNGIVVIKAAKLVGGVAEPLSAGELSGFTQYWIEKRFAGTSISIVSQDPDLLQAYYTITVDSQLIALDGSQVGAPTVFPVEDAINEFLQSFQSENFAGVMQVMKLTDAIQAVNGVQNVVATDIQARADGGSFADILAVPSQSYTAVAGYMAIDASFPLSTTLTYTNG
jgi:hypothetical protein